MLDRIAHKLTRRPKLVLLVAAVLLVLCAIGAAATGVNYDILTYLPPDLDSSQGEKLLEDPFAGGRQGVLLGGGGMIELPRIAGADIGQRLVSAGALDRTQTVRVQKRTAALVGVQVEFSIRSSAAIRFSFPAHTGLQAGFQFGWGVEAAQA